MWMIVGVWVTLIGLFLPITATHGAPDPQLADDFIIGYLQLKKDPRYARKRLYARFLGQPLGRPYQGATMALKEVKFHGQALGVSFKIKRVRVKDEMGLSTAIDELSEAGVRFFIVDIPAQPLTKLATHVQGRDLMLLNISAHDDALRQQHCQANVLHLIPSHAMVADALAQYLIIKKWANVLALVGPASEDHLLAASFARAASRFGLNIVDQRDFLLGNNPRERERNNSALLTGKADYDVVFVADSGGEFARTLPYRTLKPRPIVGSEGLAAVAWHWAWERHGAPQLEKRFEKVAKRPMQGIDWAAWIAVKMIASAAQRTSSVDFTMLRDHILGPDLVVDGFKGNRLNFRLWSHQLRQPLLLGTHNWVVARAPLEGFLHQKNKMDTLGLDESEIQCSG